MEQGDKRCYADGGNKGDVWSRIIGNSGTILTGIGGMIGSSKETENNNETVSQNNNTEDSEPKNYTALIVIGGIVLLVIGIVVYFSLKK